MPRVACTRIFHCLSNMLFKIFWSQSSVETENKQKDEGEAIPEDMAKTHKSSIANVAAYGDVIANYPPVPILNVEILGSEADDYNSWNEDLEIVEMESEPISVTKGDHSCYTTADEVIFEDNSNGAGVSGQSEKDFESIPDFLDKSDLTDTAEKYMETTEDAVEKDEVTSTKLESDGDLSQGEEHPDINACDHSSMTTTGANIASSEIEDSIEQSSHHAPLSSLEPQSNASEESFVGTLTQVTQDVVKDSNPLCEDEEGSSSAEEDEDVFAESQSTQTEDLSSLSGKKNNGQSKGRLWTKRRTRRLARCSATDSGDLMKRRDRGSIDQTVASSLFAFLKNSACCRVAHPTPMVLLPSCKRRHQRRPLNLDLAIRHLYKYQWPTNSLINTTLCGPFQLVEKTKAGPECRQPPAFAIPFLFGIKSTNVMPAEVGNSEKSQNYGNES